MLFTTKWLCSHFKNYHEKAKNSIVIDTVTTDSRREVKNALFIPLIGERFDGHDYIMQAINNGVAGAFWDINKPLPKLLPKDFPLFFVDDTLTALQELAVQYRKEVNPIVVGITGSNGKTTTKDIVTAVGKRKYKTHHTIGNLNNHIGLPLTVLSMPRDTELLVLEMGMSDFGEIELLADIAAPDYAIITNIGESHIEFLGSREGIAKAKLEIIKGLKDGGTVIFDGDEPLLRSGIRQHNAITCGFNQANDLVIDGVAVSQNATAFHLSDGIDYSVPLLGKHHAQNATFAIALGEKLGIVKEEIKRGLVSLNITSMRFELIKGKNDVSIINDAYNASATSMKAAIEVVKQLDGFTEKVLVLGDILELGVHSEALHRSVAEVIAAPVSTVFTIGNEASAITTAVTEMSPYIKAEHFSVKEDLLAALQPYLKDNVLILFKASRGLQFESLIETLIH